MMWGYNGFAGGWMMGIGMALFWCVVILAVLSLARGSARPWGDRADDFATRGRSAIDILRERYARGEVDKADFEERLQDLERTGSPPR